MLNNNHNSMIINALLYAMLILAKNSVFFFRYTTVSVTG